MKITNIRVHPRNDKSNSKLKAFVTITFDEMFVIRDLKIIEGKKGLFVAMPSMKMKESCPSCGGQNLVRSQFCSKCGTRLPREEHTENGERHEEYKEIAHPINSDFRNYMQEAILDEYEKVINAGPSMSDTYHP